jgi:glycosyltransferase involved in cell wall biosynthesis
MAAAAPAAHIVLANIMRDELASKLNISRSKIRVISNAAFQVPVSPTNKAESQDRPIRVGFLSNITFEKGFEDFFRVLQVAQERKLPVSGVIAGPTSQDARLTFDQLLSNAANVTALGPLYGEAKNQFYDGIDLFLFPTRYRNEAEPVVIHEALAYGTYVVANDRGCIREMLENGAGVATEEQSFISSSLATIESVLGDRTKLAVMARSCIAQEQRLQIQGKEELKALLDWLLDPLPDRKAAQ